MAFQSFASERFWQLYSQLPADVQRLADKQYELFREDPFHPSLQLKLVGASVLARSDPGPLGKTDPVASLRWRLMRSKMSA